MVRTDGETGYAEVRCKLAGGRLDACAVVAADPASIARLALLAAERLAPSGLKPGLVLVVPMTFAPPGAPSPVGAVRFAPLEKRERPYAYAGPVGGYYPERAVRFGMNGEAVLKCVTGQNGELDDCKAISEWPQSYDFSAAALRMALRRRILAADPVKPATTIKVRVPFQLGAAVVVAP